MKLLFPPKFGDEYEVESRNEFKYATAVVRGIKITPHGTEVTLLVPMGTAEPTDETDKSPERH